MTILGTIALIALAILSVMVLRVKSDPMDKKSIRKYLGESKRVTPKTEAGSLEPREGSSLTEGDRVTSRQEQEGSNQRHRSRA